ncbi:MAG: hypothetical protein ACRD9Q_09325 [Nitrososphaeraceae archaeon]
MKDNKHDEINDKIRKIEHLDNATSLGSRILSIAGSVAEPIVPGSSLALGVAEGAFAKVMGHFIGKKQEEILRYLVDGLRKLEERDENFKIENLEGNEKFASTVLHVLPIALRSYQKEKLEILRNVVLNAALTNTPDDDLQLTFLHYVDELTPIHIRILDFFDKKQEEMNKVYTNVVVGDDGDYLAKYFESNFPEIKDRYERYLRDLTIRGLLHHHDMFLGTLLHNIAKNGYTTDEGKKFLNYITSPIKEI